jgi:hypothetical protein
MEEENCESKGVVLLLGDTSKAQPMRNYKNKWMSEYVYDSHKMKTNSNIGVR